MLVLIRKTGQRAVIGGNIRVVVLSVHGDRVKLGFEGPISVPIHREEVHHRINGQRTDQPSGYQPPGQRIECTLAR